MLSRAYFHLPILLIFLLTKLSSLICAEFMLAIYALSIAAFSTLNTFLIKKEIKLKYIIAGGEICKAIGLFLIVFFNSSELYIALGQLIGGLGFALCIGTDSSLLRSQYLNNGQEVYQKIESSSMSLVFLVIFLAGNIGSFLYSIHSTLPFYISIFTTLVSSLIILSFHEPQKKSDDILKNASYTVGLQNKIFNIDSMIIYWMCYYVIVRATVLALFVGFLPLLLESKAISIEYFGFFLGFFSICAAVSARYITKSFLDCHKLFSSMLTAILLCMSVSLFTFFSSNMGWLIGMALLGAAAGAVRPLALSQISQKISSIIETKIILSKMEAMYGIANGFLLFIGGILAILYGLRSCFLLISLLPILFTISAPLVTFLRARKNKVQPIHQS